MVVVLEVFHFTKILKSNFIYNTTKPPPNDSVIHSKKPLYYYEAVVEVRSELVLIWWCKLEKSKKYRYRLSHKTRRYYSNPDPNAPDCPFRQSSTPDFVAIWDATRQF
jgi:hypothetical protein